MNKMDLWVRSQDRKSIVKINNQIGLNYNDNKTIIANYIPDFSDKYDGSYDILGTYETKERSLEVLDEIQKELIGDTLHSAVNKAIKNNILVYEMPKE